MMCSTLSEDHCSQRYEGVSCMYLKVFVNIEQYCEANDESILFLPISAGLSYSILRRRSCEPRNIYS